jgi:hypothetical protein
MGKCRTTGSAVPLGLMLGAGIPGVETPGYCQRSLWDEGMVPSGGKLRLTLRQPMIQPVPGS